MNEECLICKAPLEYRQNDVEMKCSLCHKTEMSKTCCIRGHYVCDCCHTTGIDSILSLCLSDKSKNSFKIIHKMMKLPFCHMHGPEHHVMVGAALLTAYKNAGGELPLNEALLEMIQRGRRVPGGACGFWGACGAGVSTGMFISIITGASPLALESWGLANQMTGKALESIGQIGGPRCCKRDSFLAILAAIDFVAEHFGVQMEKTDVVCDFSSMNNQCIGRRCPFSAVSHRVQGTEQ